jgi:tetratricopeptide (TPR) repeat protein
LESPWPLHASISKTAALSATAEALVEAGQAERSARVAAEALASAHAIPDPEMLPNVWSHIGGLLRTSVALESALAAPGAVRGGLERAWILYGAVRDRAERGDRDAAASLVDQTMSALAGEDDQLQRAVVADNVAMALAKAGWRDVAVEVFGRAASWADEIADDLRRAYALAIVASGEADAGERADGERLAERAQEAASKIGDDLARFRVLGTVARALAKAGRHAEARKTAESIPHLDYQLSALIAVANVAAERGEFQLVEAIARETALGYPENWPELAQVHSAMALGHARHGAGDAALDLARRAHPTQSGETLAAVSAALVEQKDFDRAIQAATEIADPDAKAAALSRLAPLLAATGQVQRAVEISELPEAWKSIALTRVAYRTAEAGDPIQARQLVDRALPTARRAVDVTQKLEALIDAAQAYSLIGAQDRVPALLAEAFAAAGAAGRDHVFHALQRSAGLFARIDRGESLWASSRQIGEIDGWWEGKQAFTG